MTYLIFDMYGPLSAFGDIAMGDYRPTFPHPTKSAIIGLVAGCLGIDREEESKLLELHNDLGIAILVFDTGTLLRDYHTIQVPSSSKIKTMPIYTRKDELSGTNPATILSDRDYRMGAYYRLGIWSKKEKCDVNLLQNALSYPIYAPYLGRKACPTALPFHPKLIEADAITHAMVSYPLNQWLEQKIKGLPDDAKFALYIDPQDETYPAGSDVVHKVKIRDRLRSRKHWQYREREEVMIYIGGKDVFQ